MYGFHKFIKSIGLTQNDMDKAEASMPMPMERHMSEPYTVGESSIQGKGSFASRAIRKGENIGTFKCGNEWTEIGRYSNHSDNPNCYVHDDYVYAGKCIASNEELTVNYNQVKDALSGGFAMKMTMNGHR